MVDNHDVDRVNQVLPVAVDRKAEGSANRGGRGQHPDTRER